jgi:hypothetical protein
MQHTVKQRGVHHERLGLLLFAESHLGEQLIPNTPRTTQPLKHRTINITHVSKTLIQKLDIETNSSDGRPNLSPRAPTKKPKPTNLLDTTIPNTKNSRGMTNPLPTHTIAAIHP